MKGSKLLILFQLTLLSRLRLIISLDMENEATSPSIVISDKGCPILIPKNSNTNIHSIDQPDKNPLIRKLNNRLNCTNHSQKPLGQGCLEHCECQAGLACSQQTCINQKHHESTCSTDYECLNHLGCFEGKCQPYFSQPNGFKFQANPENVYSPCQSGDSKIERDSKSKCIDYDNTQAFPYYCDEDQDCEYSYSESTATDRRSGLFKDKAKCKCALDGNRYCDLGTLNTKHRAFVDSIKRVLIGSSSLHTLERADLKISSGSDRKLVQDYINKGLELNNHWDFQAFDRKAIKAIYPRYEPTAGSIDKCARFNCLLGQQEHFVCAESLRNLTSGEIAVNMSKCNEFYKCDLKQEQIYETQHYTETCTLPDDRIPAQSRLPGESCHQDNHCRSTNFEKGKCKSRTCHGKDHMDLCYDDSDCIVGLYCDETSHCNRQKDLGDKCSKESECRNGLACYDHNCGGYYRLDSRADLSRANGIEDKKFLCRRGRYDSQADKCSEFHTLDVVNPRNSLVSCSFGQKCNYTENGIEFTLDCQCGYNELGQGYCPKSHNNSASELFWDTYFKNLARSYENECHTLSRKNCYAIDPQIKKELFQSEIYTVKSHLFYDAPSCIFEILYDSSIVNHLSVSVLVLSIIITVT